MKLLLANKLPCCFMPLTHWQLIKVTGQDAARYLQGQFTINIDLLTAQDFLLTAHCDPTGKTLSNMLVFKRDETIYYLERKSVAALQVADLKKYAVFSKVAIDIDDHQQLLGIAGQQATETLQQLNITLPDAPYQVHHQDEMTIIRLTKPELRYLIIAEPAQIAAIRERLTALGVCATHDNQWLSLDIEAGYPIIDAINFSRFLPQAMSLEKIDGISFDKGCYRGQEMVARAQFRGANKRALFQLIGHSPILPTVGEGLTILLGEHKRDVGHVLAAVKLADERILVQAILNKEIAVTDQFGVKEAADSLLTIITDDSHSAG